MSEKLKKFLKDLKEKEDNLKAETNKANEEIKRKSDAFKLAFQEKLGMIRMKINEQSEILRGSDFHLNSVDTHNGNQLTYTITYKKKQEHFTIIGNDITQKVVVQIGSNSSLGSIGVNANKDNVHQLDNISEEFMEDLVLKVVERVSK